MAQYWALFPPDMRGFHAINPEIYAFKQKKRRPEMGRPVIYTVGSGLDLLEFILPDRSQAGIAQGDAAGGFTGVGLDL